MCRDAFRDKLPHSINNLLGYIWNRFETHFGWRGWAASTIYWLIFLMVQERGVKVGEGLKMQIGLRLGVQPRDLSRLITSEITFCSHDSTSRIKKIRINCHGNYSVFRTIKYSMAFSRDYIYKRSFITHEWLNQLKPFTVISISSRSFNNPSGFILFFHPPLHIIYHWSKWRIRLIQPMVRKYNHVYLLPTSNRFLRGKAKFQ